MKTVGTLFEPFLAIFYEGLFSPPEPDAARPWPNRRISNSRPLRGMVTYSFLGDLEGFKMGQYVGLLHPPPCSSGTTIPLPVCSSPTHLEKKVKNIFWFRHIVNRDDLGPFEIGEFFARLFWGVGGGTTTPPM